MRPFNITRFFPSQTSAFSISFRILILSIVLLSCGDDGERREVVSKLRGIGVEQTPVSPTPGSTVQVVFYLLGPKGMNLTPSAYKDTAFKYGSNVDLTLIDKVPTEETVGSLSLYKLRASFIAPADASTSALLATVGSVRQRYGVQFTAPNDDETIIADAIVYPPTSPKALWKAPTIALDQPISASIGSSATLSATIQANNEETNRVAWYVSSGKVKTYNSKTTEWTEIATGEQSLILTVRGAKSGAFALKTMKVTVN